MLPAVVLLGAVDEPNVCPGSAGTAWGIGSMPTQKTPSGLFLLPAKSITGAETANLVAPETKNNWESFYQPHRDVENSPSPFKSHAHWCLLQAVHGRF